MDIIINYILIPIFFIIYLYLIFGGFIVGDSPKSEQEQGFFYRELKEERAMCECYYY